MSSKANPMKVCSDLDLLHPYTKHCALQVLKRCEEAGLSVGIFETLRSLERRKYLVSIGNSKSVNSYHGLGLAIDVVFKTPKGNWTWDRPKQDWDKLADILEECGFTAGWRWKTLKDGPHGQIDFKGVRAASLYTKLDSVNNDMSQFYDYINSLLIKDEYHAEPFKKFFTQTVSKAIPVEPKKTIKQVREELNAKTVPAVAQEPQPNIIMTIIQTILTLLGVKK